MINSYRGLPFASSSPPESGLLRGTGDGAGEPEGVEFLLNENRLINCCSRPPGAGVTLSDVGGTRSVNL